MRTGPSASVVPVTGSSSPHGSPRRRERKSFKIGSREALLKRSGALQDKPIRRDSSANKHRTEILGHVKGIVIEAQRRSKEQEHSKQRLIVRPDSQFRRYWDFLSLVCLSYVSIWTPVQVAFFGELMTWSKIDQWPVIFALDRFIDIVFVVDIFINFRSASQNPDGSVSFDSRKVSRDYAQGFLFIDIISVLPFELIQADSNPSTIGRIAKLLRLMRLAKLVRVVRASRIFARWEAAMFSQSSNLVLLRQASA